VTSDHFAGVARDETDDPRPWAELVRQWSTLHPEFAYLPRKFKIAVTIATRDRAAILSYLDAILRVYNRFGRRDNKYKARIRILVKERTPAVFARDVEAEWAHLRGGPATVPDGECARLIETYVDLRHDDERFVDTVRRVGIEPFKERGHAPAHSCGGAAAHRARLSADRARGNLKRREVRRRDRVHASPHDA